MTKKEFVLAIGGTWIDGVDNSASTSVSHWISELLQTVERHCHVAWIDSEEGNQVNLHTTPPVDEDKRVWNNYTLNIPAEEIKQTFELNNRIREFLTKVYSK